jgi:hypothetical protein
LHATLIAVDSDAGMTTCVHAAVLTVSLPWPLQALHGVGATRDIGNKLVHEEPQKPSQLPDDLKPSHPGRAMDSDDKKVRGGVLHKP